MTRKARIWWVLELGVDGDAVGVLWMWFWLSGRFLILGVV
jgi:hypothetical protein